MRLGRVFPEPATDDPMATPLQGEYSHATLFDIEMIQFEFSSAKKNAFVVAASVYYQNGDLSVPTSCTRRCSVVFVV